MQVPAPFAYERATSVDHAIGLLDRLGDAARLVAGGHSLLPMMKLRQANFAYLIDINDLAAELRYIEVEPDRIRIGALTRHREMLESTALAETFPIFADAEQMISDPVVRERGTLGGSLCQADPSEDLSAVCTTLGASCVIQGREGRRLVAMEDFHRGPYETAVGDAEMLIEARFPVRPYGSSAYEKVERRAGDWAVASAGAAVWLDGVVIADARVGLAAVGPNSMGLPEISRALRGRLPSEELYTEAGAIAAASCEPVTDRRGSADYKRHLVRELTARVLRRSVARARSDRIAKSVPAGASDDPSARDGGQPTAPEGPGD
ncbi:xanthine dehydrogenase family protein subunit M [Streptomyces sp. AK02-01A]|uniref:FAD binding domain-containing protein n=1 Tax=Streptomyces sp. AK02-01A TaxID=3028648 RepID=UPI0029BD9ACB|nr:xanthine dehydrogenase family protein subunit M [Streptomyces sp. AK02-01A]MDX3849647.1 xanthine dehydrogenase family protein subunit M [Streptomyces sp. AK02-01A]MDX3849783.1 xanthine dehydrogenase family protein subunit M [Streptomyces sp. AK02-01A]